MGRGALFSRCRWIQSGFERLPAPELLLLCLSKREVTKRKRHPAAPLSGHPALRVRESGPGFSSGLLPARKGVAIPGNARCAALSSPPHRRRGAPGKAARSKRAEATARAKPKAQSKGIGPQLDQPSAVEKRLAGATSFMSSVSRYVAGWPLWGDVSAGVGPIPSTQRACRVGGLNQAISLGYFSLGQQREVARAPAGDRNRFVACEIARS